MSLNEILVGPSHAWKVYGRTNCKDVIRTQILLDVQHFRAKEFPCKPSDVTDRGYLLLNILILVWFGNVKLNRRVYRDKQTCCLTYAHACGTLTMSVSQREENFLGLAL